MKNWKRAAIGVLATAATVVPTVAAIPTADAAARHWTTIETGFGAKHQACKVAVTVNGVTGWKVYNRLNSSAVTGGRLRSTMTVDHYGVRTVRKWDSGWVAKGTISAVGSVTILTGKPGNSLEMSLYGDNAGSGGVIRLGHIGGC